MPGARSHEALIAWQLAHALKLRVRALLRVGTAGRDRDFAARLRRSAAAAPRIIAEGFGTCLPGDFATHLRCANGAIRETCDALQDGCGRGHFSRDDVALLLGLARRSSNAATNLTAYLRTATRPDRPRHDLTG
jgi:four helix bundle protein